ncbi:MAG TPA: GAF domain-containing protein [Patescibacteria group bacterium]|nr:GAF domain-containing protein [Patescibacteria group bacterium]
MTADAAEKARLAALSLYKILDTAEEQVYDDLTHVAAYIARTPVALISFVDRDRQWFKSRVGIDITETPREYSFCAHAIKTPDMPLLVHDAQKDARFADNPYVTGAPGVRFYFGAPLRVDSDNALGSLCVIDTQPRDLDPSQIEALNALSRQVVTMLQIRKDVMALGDIVARSQSTKATDPRLDEVDRLTRELQDILFKKQGTAKNS